MQKDIIQIISKYPDVTPNKVAEILGVPFEDIRVEFSDLLKNGYILEKMMRTTNIHGGTQVFPVYVLGSKSFELGSDVDKTKKKGTGEKEYLNKVFLSHSSKDKRLANKFIDEILVKKIGLSKTKDIFFTSFAESGVEPTEDFRMNIKKNLRGSQIYIAFVSERFRKSEMCLAELGGAWILDIPVFQLAIFPIKKSECTFLFNAEQALNLTHKNEMKVLIGAIQKKLSINKIKKVDEKWVGKICSSLSSINSDIRKKNSTELKISKSVEKTKKIVTIDESEELLLPGFPLINNKNKSYKKLNPEFLYNEIGSFMVWIDYVGDSKLSNHVYIVAHCGNGGESVRSDQYLYENVWAIKRSIVQSNPKKMAWGFTCSDEEGRNQTINSYRSLNSGRHLFTVTWNRLKNRIRFYIDRSLEGETEFNNWPKYLENEIFVGTWPNKHSAHYFNSKIGLLKVVHGKEYTVENINKEIKKNK